MKTFSSKIVISLFVTAVSAALFGCGDNEGRDGQLLQAKRDETAELERLRKLQTLRAWQPTQERWDTWENPFSFFSGTPIFTRERLPANACDAGDYLGEAEVELAKARTFKQIADTESVFRFKPGNGTTIEYEFPPQELTTRVAVYIAARRYLRNALYYTLTQLGRGPLGEFGWVSQLEADCGNGERIVTYAPKLIREIMDLYEEVTFAAAKTSVQAGDALAGKAASKEEGLAWRYSAALYSRASAAHLILGGDELGWGNSTSASPFCSGARLQPGGKLALEYLRQAGQNPNDILSETKSTLDLLDKCSDSEGILYDCTRIRLAEILHRPELKRSDVKLAEAVNLKMSDFEEARAYLKAEIKGLRRNVTKTLPLQDAGQTMPQYAGVATKPVQLPSVVWAALGRGASSVGGIATQVERWAPDYSWIEPLDYVNDPSLSEIYFEIGSQLLSAMYEVGSPENYDQLGWMLGNEAIDNIWSPVEQVRERVSGKALVVPGNASNPGELIFTVYDQPTDNASEHLFLVDGEDGLRCALDGKIEGADCELNDYRLAATTNVGSTNEAVPYIQKHVWQLVLPSVEANQRRTIYVIDAKSGHNVAVFGAEVAFNAERSMTGFVTGNIMPHLYERVASYVALDADWCGQTQFDCRGFRADERIPLENSLATDADPMESSWKYYLELAKSAAEDARTRGEEYFRAGLEFELRKESNWSLAHDASVKAAAAIDEVQDICGTAIDARKLLKLLSSDGENGDELCSSSVDCIGVLISKAKNYPGDADMSRLVECLDPGTIRPFVSVGTNSLCVWVDKTNANKVCEGASKTYPCPTRAQEANGVPSCATMAIPSDQNAQAADVITERDLLKYFSNSQPSPSGLAKQAQKVCEYVRDLRYGTALGGGSIPPKVKPNEVFTREEWWKRIVDSHFFEHANLKAMGTQGIRLKLRPRNNFELTFNGETVWSTGDRGITSSASNGMWPCGSGNMAEDCTEGRGGLFCEHFSCDTPEHRDVIVSRMRAAVEFALNGGIAPGLFGGDAETYDGVPGGYIDVPYSSDEANDGAIYENDEDRADYWGCAASKDYRGTETSGAIDRSFEGEVGLSWRRCDASTDLVGANETSRWDTAGSVQTYWWFEGVPNSTLWAWSNTETPWMWDGTKGLYISSANTPYRQRWFGSYLHVPKSFYSELTRASVDCSYCYVRPGGISYDTHYNRVEESKVDSTAASYRTSDFNLAKRLFFLKEGVKQRGPCRWDDPNDITQGAVCVKQGLSTLGVLDAVELSCQVIASKGGRCSFDAPPDVSSVNDLSTAQRYLACLADSLESSGGDVVFARMPERVRDVLVEEGGTGAFPAVGGKYGVAVSTLRGALVDLADIPGAVGFEVRQLANAVEQINTARTLLGVQNEMVGIQQQMTAIDTMMKAVSVDIFSPGSFLGAASALAKLDLSNQLATLQKKENELGMDLKLQELGDQLSQRARTLQTYATRIKDAVELINAQLTELERLRLQAGSKVVEAINAAEYQAPNSDGIDNSYAWKYGDAKRQYDVANDAAVRLAVLARKSIEQRLGINLEEMTQELPLVNAPSSWANEICEAKGLDFESILKDDATSSTNSGFSSSDKPVYLGHYIGEYVSKLEKTVESYRQVNPFADGVDEAIVSVRDDLQKVSAKCSVLSPNLFPNSSGVASGTTLGTPGAGWRIEGCPSIPDGDSNSGNDVQYACLMVDKQSTSWVVDGQSVPTYDFDFSFHSCEGLGCPKEQRDVSGAMQPYEPSVATSVKLDRGNYYVAIYQGNYTCEIGLNVSDATGAALNVESTIIAPHGYEPISRRVWKFSAEESGQFDFTFGVVDPTCTLSDRVVRVGGPTLQQVPYDSYSMFKGIIPYTDSDSNGMWSIPTCKDSDGSAFRRQGWVRKCMRLCRSGYGESCTGQVGQEECFNELRFQLDDVILENGMALQASGFAKGNYNYRVDQVAVNFVGTGIRNCGSSETQAACSSNASVQYSFEHKGPFYTRNYMGDDVQSLVYDGRIEHARGLAAERYLTNPLSSVDRALMDPYVRSELKGWPLSGEYILRVWDSSDVSFENISDVQLYLKYRYWTRLK